jgi:hypothetical protein
MWRLYRYTNRKLLIGEMPGPPDIWGDELYAWMEENIDGFRLDDYDCDGDNFYVAVMAKHQNLPSYGWEYEEDA